MTAARSRHGVSPRLLLAALALTAAGVQLVRVARDLKRYRASQARLSTTWTTIESPAGGPPLKLRTLLNIERATSLPPIVLVHGFGLGTKYLVPLAGQLADQARVYAVDLPGHGPSDHDARPLSIGELAEALAAWIDASALKKTLLVGHSLGCQVAAEVAARRPDLVSGLVLVGPTSDAAARTRAHQISRSLRGSRYERSSFALWAAIDFKRAGARLLAHEMREMVEHRIEDVLAKLKIPVRVVRGARDRIVPQEWAEKVARVAGAPEPTVVGGRGHAVHYDEPASVAKVTLELAEFIKSASQTPALSLPQSVDRTTTKQA